MDRPVTMVNTLAATEAVTLATRNRDVVHEMTLAGAEQGMCGPSTGRPMTPTGVPVHEGQRVRLRFSNTTTMFHPMRLHGHTFQIHGAKSAGRRWYWK